MKKVFGVLILLMFTLTSCAKNNVSDPNTNISVVPTYEGMLIKTTNKAYKTAKDIIDVKNHDLSIDVEELIDLGLEQDSKNKYYVDKGEEFNLLVKLNNPSSFVIQSITINDEIYASYLFEESSDMENIYIKLTAPLKSGYKEYTINEIKYIDSYDNFSIKEAKLLGEKTIKAGIIFEDEPQVSISNLNINPTSFEFNVEFININNLLDSKKIYLFLSDGTKIVEKLDLKSGRTNIKFNDLLIGKYYQYAVVTSYDICDGNYEQERILVKDIIKTLDAFSFEDVAVDKTSIAFSIIKQGTTGTIESFEILDKATNKIVKSNDDITTRLFNGLVSNHEYILIMHFNYSVNGELVTGFIDYLFKTDEKVSPTVEVIDTQSTQNTVSFDLCITDVDNICLIEKIELINYDKIIELSDVKLREFTNLLSNTTYELKVTYKYDLNDGIGQTTKTSTIDVTTMAKKTPSISLSNFNNSSNSISADIIENDVDKINNITRVELYKGTTLITSNESLLVYFDNLESLTEYTIVITINYDLNDGEGIVENIYKFNVSTNIELNLIDFSLKNTSSVSEGEYIIVSATLTNPSNAVFTRVIINGIEYLVDSSSNSTLIVRILCNGHFSGGQTKIIIEEIYAKIGNVEYSATIDENNTVNIFINGKLSVEKIQVVNEFYEDSDYFTSKDKLYIKVNIDNPTGYKIDSISYHYINIDNSWEKFEFSISDFIVSDDYFSIIFPVEYKSSGYYKYYLDSLVYSNKNINSKELTFAEMYVLQYFITETVNISKVEDLYNMNQGHNYVLTNDIDLNGIEWDGKDFDGVFDGQNYSIKNMSVVNSYTDKNVYLGLFDNARGIIKNINFIGIFYDVTVSSTSDKAFDLYYGSISAKSNNLEINNCSIDNTSYIKILNNMVHDYYYSIGGFIGESTSDTIITDSCNRAKIIGSNKVGGVLGNSYSGSLIINNTSNEGEISGKNDVGGILGHSNSSVSVLIKETYNVGKITGYNSLGGIIGKTIAYVLKIDNSYNYGKVIGEDNHIGGLIGLSSSNTIINNSYNNGDISTRTFNIGGIIGCSSEETLIKNTYNKGNITCMYNDVGGIIGRNTSNITLDYCYNTGNLNGNEDIGGLIGRTWDTSTTIVKNSNNSGYISGNDNLGGIIGYSTGSLEIYDSNNVGRIKGDEKLGGIIGVSQGSLTIEKSYNEGVVIGNGIVAGIVGYSLEESTITNTYNIGNVTAKNNVSGIIGASISTTSLDYCYNEGDITGSGDYVSGIIAHTLGETKISNTYNCGSISGANGIGGIIGVSEEPLTIYYCYNDGNIIGTGTYVGGVVGQTLGKTVINNTYNSASVKGQYGVGGLLGDIGGNSNHIVTNSFNTGSINGISYIGGTIGAIFDSSSKITILNTFNVGVISGDSGIAGIIGCIIKSSATIIINNSFNANSIKGSVAVDGIVGGASDSPYYKLTVTNTHILNGCGENDNGGVYTTLTNLNTKTFYLNTLLWDESVWYLDNLDYLNNKYPRLKS